MWLGFDFGTQSVRVVAVSEAGCVLAQGSRPLTSRRDGSRHEQDAEEWWRAAVSACRAVLANLPASAIRGLAIDGTSGTILLMDRSGNALTAGLMYDDTRAGDEARRANEAGADIWASLGYCMQPSWALPKLLWLLREYGGVISDARLAHQVDFINRRLAGHEVPSDSSNALKAGYDLVRETWPYEVLEALGVPDQIMPSVVRSGTPLGAVCSKAAAMTGIPTGTPIIAGMTDGCAAQISAGALEVGSWNSVLGSTLVLKGVSRGLIRDPAGIVYSHRSPDGNWLPGGASSTGAAILAKQFPGRDLGALSAQAAEREPASVIAYPLVSRGERFPFRAPDAEGFVLGDPSDETDLYAALLQGVSFMERLCFDYLDMLGLPIHGELSLTGGAARSRYWCQLRADILRRPIRLPENAETAFGMAVLAASVGRPISHVAKEMVRIGEVIEPRPDRIGRFHEPYLRLVEELARRGWAQPALVEHAMRRVAESETSGRGLGAEPVGRPPHS
jgi:sugar (pentulose or hexulose) kinase